MQSHTVNILHRNLSDIKHVYSYWGTRSESLRLTRIRGITGPMVCSLRGTRYTRREQRFPVGDSSSLCSRSISSSFVCFIRAIIMINKLILDTHIKLLVNKATCHPLKRPGVEIIKLGLRNGIRHKKDPVAVDRKFHSARCKPGARGSVVVKVLCYKPEGSGFDTR
jgi:hypothetical protein